MLGIIPHTIDQYLKQEVALDTRQAILVRAGFPYGHTFRIDAEYDDKACCALVGAAAVEMGTTTESVFDSIAEFFIEWAEQNFSGFFQAAPDTRGFLLMQPDIHNSLACGLRSSAQRKVADKFRVVALPDGVRLQYRSSNRLSYFYCALARSLATRRGEIAEIIFVDGDHDSVASVIEVRLKPAQAV
ncbi:heme NO-binding domain-containing protein [Acidocella aminolytica]|uniref:Heme NO-binding domain-containing protein n=1 Tax=Acidocella aminolytica 101 = DSM 11237 TaxID=1120923 RepID=A0A0D6PLG7_9PROT|nr:heme NO-binding domain-containing protein [Acidocella aminolytica]GAN82078.1 hypothetical protein Aam_151_004 [Acidocella aminolytica 101 = DSM 11237]GBQ32716.1 heme NO binding domain-containing protein [Acidocella aminolytica 101 = DSM 11237]SHF33825.1 Haem-NO-binding [Acidocella aminolytica 101 = DSM 11237]